MNCPEKKRTFPWKWARHIVQICALVLFCLPLLVAGWELIGLYTGIDDPVATPAELPFYGSLSSTTIFGLEIMDPYALMQVVAASKTIALSWLIAALPVLLFYGLIRGRAFCGWICPVNLFLEIIDWLRIKLHINVAENPLPRHTKIYVAIGVLIVSALFSIPVFEAFSPISAINKFILFGATTGILMLFAIVILELFWGHRVWCRSLCPLGGFYEVLGKVGQVNVQINHDACISCHACQKACLCDPEILTPAITGQDDLVRAGDCMVCGSCINACPTGALSFKLGKLPQKKDVVPSGTTETVANATTSATETPAAE